MLASYRRDRQTVLLCHMSEKLIKRNHADLNQCGWYHSQMLLNEAEEILSKCSHGTFILRNGHCDLSKYPYTLSVSYNDIVLHISIQIKSSGFCLKTRHIEKIDIPQNKSLIRLIEQYILFTKKRSATHPCWSFNGELRGHITIKRPFCKEVNSLQHLCRLQLNRNRPIEIPHGLHIFMDQYTFKV